MIDSGLTDTENKYGGFRVWLVIMRDALVEGDKVPVRRRSCYENRIESFALVAQVKIERERRTLTLIFEGKLYLSASDYA